MGVCCVCVLISKVGVKLPRLCCCDHHSTTSLPGLLEHGCAAAAEVLTIKESLMVLIEAAIGNVLLSFYSLYVCKHQSDTHTYTHIQAEREVETGFPVVH